MMDAMIGKAYKYQSKSSFSPASDFGSRPGIVGTVSCNGYGLASLEEMP
jgi:hypothetical protein